MHDSDRQLVARLLAGDSAAFKAYFDANFDRLFRFALALTRGDADRAEEAAQRALVRGTRALASYRGDAALFTWLAQICRNELADVLADAKRRDAGARSIDADDGTRRQAQDVVDSRPLPDETRDAEDIGRIVREVLDALPPPYGDILEWKYLEDASVDDIAGRLRTTAIAVQSLLARARTTCRVAFRERGVSIKGLLND